MAQVEAYGQPYKVETKTISLVGDTEGTEDFNLLGGYAGLFDLAIKPSDNTGDGLDNITLTFHTLIWESGTEPENATFAVTANSGLTYQTGQDWSTDDVWVKYDLNSIYASNSGDVENYLGAGLRVAVTNVSGAGGDTGTLTLKLGKR